MQLLKDQIKIVLPNATQRAILATAIMAESNAFPAVDARKPEVLALEQELNKAGANRADAILASKIVGAEVKIGSVASSVIKPQFTGVLVAVKPYGAEGETNRNGIDYGTSLLCVKANSDHRAGGSNWRSATKLFSNMSFSTADYRPATEDEVTSIVKTLFDARPALTLKLFGIKFEGGVQSIPSTGEEE